MSIPGLQPQKRPPAGGHCLAAGRFRTCYGGARYPSRLALERRVPGFRDGALTGCPRIVRGTARRDAPYG